MTAQALLHDLTAHGVILSAMDGQLDIDAPGEALTDELLATLRENKAELLELLAWQSETNDSDVENIEMHDSAPMADEACPDCGGPVLFERGKQFLHVWCPSGGYDSWRAMNGLKLKQTDAPIFRRNISANER